ncbi:MAG: cold shock domain-containing protein [Patescibacteria group bacterium]
MNTGVVKFFNENKGYGFITDDASLNEYFVHISKLKIRIKKDDKVSFEIEQGKKGMQAINVKLLN